MKTEKNITRILLFLAIIFIGCQDDDPTLGEFTTPTNLQVTAEIVGQDANNPNGDGSGEVIFTAIANNAITYKFVYPNGGAQVAPSGVDSPIGPNSFSTLGVNTYVVTVLAYGTGGNSTSTTISVDVLATYAPPSELLDLLVGDGTKTWRVKSEANKHFGLGPVGGLVPCEWYGAGPGEKASTGMYDDRYVFNIDGTFTHITNSINDDPNTDVTGTVFGRDPYIVNDLGPTTEVPNGADIENYSYNDYSGDWALIAPGGVETISLSDLSFLGYYTGGSHSYEIFDRSVPNEMTIKTTDANSEFDWWFIITSEEEGNEDFQSIYNNLVWSDEFDVDGAPNAANWTYDLGAGGWGNAEEQTYTNNLENAEISDGTLKITAIANGGSYTSARLKSENLFEFTYGRIEARAKLPASAGSWSAMWMLGEDCATNPWPACGEIDMMEHIGNNLNIVYGTLHYPGNSGGNADGSTIAVGTATTEFHDYTVEWTPDTIKILVDNTVYHTTANSTALPYNSDFFLILNVAMGGTLGGTIDPAFTEDTLEIDYIRVYQ